MASEVFTSFYGGRSALAGNVGAQVRKQEVFTPDWILDAARGALGGTIVLDPCASTDPRNWFASYNFCLPPEAVVLDAAIDAADAAGNKPEVKRLTKAVEAYYLAGALAEEWDVGPAFVNPAFKFLEEWMCKVQQHRFPTVLLCPARVRREWWWRYSEGQEKVFLRGIVFKGYKQAFTEPCAVIGYNCQIPDLGKHEVARRT